MKLDENSVYLLILIGDYSAVFLLKTLFLEVNR